MKIFFLIMSVSLFIVATNSFSADFLYHSDGPYKGKVIDLDTGKPIEGAVVAGVWVLEFNFTPFCDAKETVTDKNGEFILPKASCLSLWPLAQMGRLGMIVFKPGYLAYPPLGATFKERRARMPDFTGDEFKNKRQYSVIRLGKPETRMERELTYGDAGGLFTIVEAFGRLPILLRLNNEERKNLGLPGEEGK